MDNKSGEKIIKSLKQILSLYKIDIDPALGQALSSSEDIDYNYLIEATQKKIDELDQRAKEILAQTGMTQEQMEVFANNPDNFSPEEWQALEDIRASCSEYRKETEALIDSLSSSDTSSNVPEDKKKKKKSWFQS